VQQVRLGSIGLGWWGKVLAEAVGKVPDVAITSCYARGEAGRAAFAGQFGCRQADSLDDLLADPEIDGVLIATSHESHRSLIEQAASAGKHIFVEKPLTTTVADGLASVEAAEKAGVLLQVGHQRRRNTIERKLKEMIVAGELGDIEMVEASQSIPNGFTMPDEAWRWDKEQSPLGSMASLGIHRVDSFHYLLGPVKSVFAFTRPGRTKPIDEATVLAFEFESGAVGSLVTSFFVARVVELTIAGTDATAFSRADGSILEVQKRGELSRTEIPLTAIDPVADQLAEFARAIRGEAEVEVNGRVALEVIRVLEAATESARTRRAVDLEDYR
jgi:predicted dehydrogenase